VSGAPEVPKALQEAPANFHVARDSKLLLYSHSHHANTDVIGCPDSKLKLSEFAY
jgi:hypothetical protein